MDCFVAVPGDRAVVPYAAVSTLLPSAAVGCSYAVGAAVTRSARRPTSMSTDQAPRGSLFLPRLSSIPEAAEQKSDLATFEDHDFSAAATAAAESATALTSASGSQHLLYPMSQEAAMLAQPGQAVPSIGSHGTNADDDCCSHCSSSRKSSESGSTAAMPLDAEPLSPAVVANTWAINIRHFTDCVPFTADSVCSTSTCHTLHGRHSSDGACGPADVPASSTQGSSQQPDTHRQHQQQQADLHCMPTSSSSCCSLGPAAASAVVGDGKGEDCEASLLPGICLRELDASEWQPWDRVATWLEAHAAAGSSGTAPPAHFEGRSSNLAHTADTAAAAAGAGLHSSRSRPSSSRLSATEQHLAASVTAAAASISSDVSTGQDQQQEELLFDAPEWWQDAVLARLQEQRDAFKNSWWSRVKVLTGLAAHRAASALQL